LEHGVLESIMRCILQWSTEVGTSVAGRRVGATLFTRWIPMIRKLKDGQYRLYSRKKDRKTGKRKNLGTFKSRAAAEKHERAVQFFKHG
jgi:hypothetical protein